MELISRFMSILSRVDGDDDDLSHDSSSDEGNKNDIAETSRPESDEGGMGRFPSTRSHYKRESRNPGNAPDGTAINGKNLYPMSGVAMASLATAFNAEVEKSLLMFDGT